MLLYLHRSVHCTVFEESYPPTLESSRLVGEKNQEALLAEENFILHEEYKTRRACENE